MRQGLGLPLDGSAEETGPCQAVRNTIVANAVAIATTAAKVDQFWIIPPMEFAPGQRQNRWILIPSFPGSNPGAPTSPTWHLLGELAETGSQSRASGVERTLDYSTLARERMRW